MVSPFSLLKNVDTLHAFSFCTPCIQRPRPGPAVACAAIGSCTIVRSNLSQLSHAAEVQSYAASIWVSAPSLSAPRRHSCACLSLPCLGEHNITPPPSFPTALHLQYRLLKFQRQGSKTTWIILVGWKEKERTMMRWNVDLLPKLKNQPSLNTPLCLNLLLLLGSLQWGRRRISTSRWWC